MAYDEVPTTTDPSSLTPKGSAEPTSWSDGSSAMSWRGPVFDAVKATYTSVGGAKGSMMRKRGSTGEFASEASLHPASKTSLAPESELSLSCALPESKGA